MTLPRLQAMTNYWNEHPPTHVLLAAFVGIKSKTKSSQNVSDMMSELAGLGFAVEPKGK